MTDPIMLRAGRGLVPTPFSAHAVNLRRHHRLVEDPPSQRLRNHVRAAVEPLPITLAGTPTDEIHPGSPVAAGFLRRSISCRQLIRPDCGHGAVHQLE